MIQRQTTTSGNRTLYIMKTTPEETTAPSPWNPKTAAAIVRVLNEHHRRTSAGFYGSAGMNGRFFRARFNAGTLEVFDFDKWYAVTPENAVFHDHNGQNITLSRGK